MNRMKVKSIREAWGTWERRNETLAHHPLNKVELDYIHDAYVNLVMSVQVSTHLTGWGVVVHLWIRRHDQKPMIWRDMQRVKNELVGKHRCGIEVYPPATDVIDQANIYHLWILPEGFQLPFSVIMPKEVSPND